MLFPWPAFITILNVLLLIWAMWQVGRARGRHQIKPPATTGHPDFERVFRMHANTLEATVMFLPCLWLAAIHWNPRYAGILGAVWLVGRVWYGIGYMASVQGRNMGFMVALVANAILLIAAVYGMFAPMVFPPNPMPTP